MVYASLENEQYLFVVRLRFDIAMVTAACCFKKMVTAAWWCWCWCLGFTLPTDNFKSHGKIINQTIEALPA